MGERDEDLLLALPGLCHLGPDLGRAADIPVLVTQALKDPLGRVALLDRSVTIRKQDLVDNAQELPQLRFRPGRALAIARRLSVGQDLLQGLRADPEVPSDRALRGASRPAPCAGSPSTSPCRCAPFSRPLARRSEKPGGGRETTGMVRCSRFRCAFASQVLSVSISVYTLCASRDAAQVATYGVLTSCVSLGTNATTYAYDSSGDETLSTTTDSATQTSTTQTALRRRREHLRDAQPRRLRARRPPDHVPDGRRALRDRERRPRPLRQRHRVGRLALDHRHRHLCHELRVHRPRREHDGLGRTDGVGPRRAPTRATRRASTRRSPPTTLTATRSRPSPRSRQQHPGTSTSDLSSSTRTRATCSTSPRRATTSGRRTTPPRSWAMSPGP